MRALFVQQSSSDGPGRLGEWFADGGVALELCRADLGDPVPPRCDADLLVVLGGPMGCHDDADAPWLPALRELLREAVAGGVPTLAVCLGAQVLADTFGGAVERANGGPEIGVHEVELSDAAADDPVFAGSLRRLPAAQWHWDAITALPPDVVLLASSSAYAHQAFRLGARVWGVQFHPELTPQTAAEWGREDAESLSGVGIDAEQAVADIAAGDDALVAAWRPLAERFIALGRPAPVAAAGTAFHR